MGHQEVRRALAAYMGTPPLPGVVTTYRAVPTRIEGESWAPYTDTGWGAALAIHLGQKRERRVSMPSGDGIKEVTYQATILIAFRWLIPDDEDGTVEPDGWADAWDGLLDLVEARVRDDPTFGTGPGGTIFQAGEGEGDVSVDAGLPAIDNEQVLMWGAVDVEVVEMVRA